MLTSWLTVDRSCGISLFRQIYEQIRNKILHGELQAGEKLPSTRELADSMHVSRNVVLEAYDQLTAEGYLESSPGSGTYIAGGALLHDFTEYAQHFVYEQEQTSRSKSPLIDFRTGVPALDHIPIQTLKRVMQEIILNSPSSLWSYGEPEGCISLRNTLVPYLHKTRGVYCKPEQIVITTGTVQALSLLAQLLIDRDDEVIVEDPVHEQIQKIFQSHGAFLIPVPVDQSGLDTRLLDQDANPKLIYTAPSHQFPLGSVMSIQRRLELIQYARLKNSFIIEDDYDSEFRYECAPVSSLQGLDPERVIYVGTFSKTLSPALRIGYIVLPVPLVESCREQKRLSDHHSPSLEQHLIARIIENGFLQRHISRMRKIYKKKQEELIRALKSSFPEIEIAGESTGLHVIAAFNGVIFTDELVTAIENKGVRIYPVEKHAILKGFHAHKLIFGYVNLSAEEMAEGVKRIKQAIADRNSAAS